jgi:hypothetical protein
VITFSESNMQIWKLKAPVAYITDEEASLLVDEYGSLDEVTERYERTGTGVERLSFFDNLKGTKTDFGCKSIRVDLELEVPRDLLPACVDSLSVHRFLNSGTFRYLHSANNALVPETVLPDFLPTTGEPLSLLANSPVKEGKFGCFVRKYFDWLRDVANQMSFQETYGLTDPEIFTLCTSIMSPAQLETAASILVNSLGLTLDVGVGKGLDVVDVRASVRHQKDWKGRIETIISELTTLMGGNIKPEIAAFLRKNGTLVIQCKDYNHKKDVEAHGHLIYFQPTGVSNGRVLTLASVRSYLEKNTEALASFHDWLSLVQFNYKVGKNILGLSGASATEQ